LITGGAAGIGKATAERFVEEGARVVICDVNAEAGQALAESSEAIRFYKVDIADRAAAQAWVDEVAAEYGRIDILVNNAGVLRDGLLVKFKDGELAKQMPEADFDLVISVNLKGVFNCTQAVALPERILDSMKGRTPIQRLGEPRDVADAYVFLASDEASFISGAVLRVDGGIVIGT
jgi:3-oxoacyl-[acyl-carrier protein] reductase